MTNRLTREMGNQPPPSSPSSVQSNSSSPNLDTPLHTIGFQIDEVSPTKVAGHLLVTPKCCQPFKVLHGGVAALIAEAVASIGAHLASDLKRVAGINLHINHIKHADLGDLVFAQAVPLNLGRTIQVWEVQQWKAKPDSPEDKTLTSSSRVTLLCNLPVPDHAKRAGANLQKFAKL